MNRKIPTGKNCHSQQVYGIFPTWQLNSVAPPNNIFGLQEEAREKIKPEETKMPVNLSKLPNLFFQIVKYLVYKKISKGETCVLTQFLKSPIHRDKGSHVFIPHKIILFLNCKMYLSKLLNVFVQIAERQNSNTISFVFH